MKKFRIIETKEKLYNFVNEEDTVVCDVWFKDIICYEDGLYKVELQNGEIRYMDDEGNLHEHRDKIGEIEAYLLKIQDIIKKINDLLNK